MLLYCTVIGALQMLGKCALAFNVIDPTNDTAAAATAAAVTTATAITGAEQPLTSHKGFKVYAHTIDTALLCACILLSISVLVLQAQT
jgi:predicted lipoprotein with Yx(FWY)xxD motif